MDWTKRLDNLEFKLKMAGDSFSSICRTIEKHDDNIKGDYYKCCLNKNSNSMSCTPNSMVGLLGGQMISCLADSSVASVLCDDLPDDLSSPTDLESRIALLEAKQDATGSSLDVVCESIESISDQHCCVNGVAGKLTCGQSTFANLMGIDTSTGGLCDRSGQSYLCETDASISSLDMNDIESRISVLETKSSNIGDTFNSLCNLLDETQIDDPSMMNLQQCCFNENIHMLNCLDMPSMNSMSITFNEPFGKCDLGNHEACKGNPKILNLIFNIFLNIISYLDCYA